MDRGVLPATAMDGGALTRSDDSLLERAEEVGTLRATLADAVAGTGGVAVIEGEAGVGKSRLLVALREAAVDAHARVLTARAGELERDFPFGIVRQLFEPLLLDPAMRDRVLAGAAAPAAAVFESLGEETDGPADASFASLHGLYWLTVNLSAGGPLLLTVDDLHWCDPPSLRFLSYLVRRLEGLPVLVGTTLRTAEPGTDAASLADIVHDPASIAVRPRRLSQEAVAAFVRERLGEDAAEAFVTACHRATGGNPLLLRQLVKTLESEHVRPDAAHVDVVRDIGPRAVSRSVLLRLARLGEPAGSLARAVAVLGESADLPAVAALTGTGEAEAAEATGALARAEILRPERPLGFVHPLVRDAVYRELPVGERELLHARAARLLLDSGAPGDQVAAQLLSTPPRGEDWVIDLLMSAGRSAIRRGAADSGVAYLRRALDEPPAPEKRPGLLFELGVAEVLIDSRGAVERLRQARRELSDPVLRGRAAFALARVLLFTAPPDEVSEVAREGLEETPESESDLRDALEALEHFAMFFGAEPGRSPQRLRELRDRPIGPGPGAKMLASVTLWQWTVTDGNAGECAARALELMSDGVLVDGDDVLFTVGVILPLTLADRDEALDAWEYVRERTHRRGSIFAALGVALWRGLTLLHRGELEESEALFREANEAMQRWDPTTEGRGTPWTVSHMARCLRERGDVAGAGRVLYGVEPDPHSDSERYWYISHVEQLLAEGRAEEAVAAMEVKPRSVQRVHNPATTPWLSTKALALDAAGRTAEAIAAAEEELPLARHWGSPGTLGRTLRILGTLKREDGLPELEEAVAVLEGSAARLEHAKALAALGSALRRARQPTEAREPLRRALELADICSATPLAEHVRSELYATGARPRTEALSGVESLTASERRVADLAAQGQTNRDIAQALYVTPKTVEVHLSNAYRKLGIRSRRELAGALLPS
jgi:DNA-binding CsgD family transcriptional regulator